MGLFSGLLLLPLAPVRGAIWLSEQLLEQASRELSDPALIYRQLAEVEEARAAGEITAEESAAAEEVLVARLMQAHMGRTGKVEA